MLSELPCQHFESVRAAVCLEGASSVSAESVLNLKDTEAKRVKADSIMGEGWCKAAPQKYNPSCQSTTQGFDQNWLTFSRYCITQVFEKLFTSELQGSAHPSVTVDSVQEKDALVELLRFCYTKSIPNALGCDKEALIRLLILADRYSVGGAIQAIARALQEDAKLEDACRILDLPGSIREQEAMKGLLAFSEELIRTEMLDLDNAYKNRKYERLSMEGLRLALANDASRVACEHTVFMMVYKWSKGGAGRGEAFSELSRLVRYHHMTSGFLNLIQQLPETEETEVASIIRRALVIRGLRDEHCYILAQDKNREGKLKFQGALPLRPGAVTPFAETFELAVDKARLCALHLNGSFCIDKREVFGYILDCTVDRVADGFGLLTRVSTSFPRENGLERLLGPTDGLEPDNSLPLFIKLGIEHHGQGFTDVSNMAVTTQQFGIGRAWWYITVLKLRLGGEGSNELLAENFVEEKLKLQVSIMFP